MKLKRELYLGLRAPEPIPEREIVHYPIIKAEPRSPEHPDIKAAMQFIQSFTHLILTSQSAISPIMDCLKAYSIQLKTILNLKVISVGKSTASLARSFGFKHIDIAKNETAEGVVELLSTIDLTHAHVFWPHSALSRPIITDYLKASNIRFSDCIVYDTLQNKVEPLPALHLFEEITFTSPSTIDAFVQFYGSFPLDKTINCLGPITRQHYEKVGRKLATELQINHRGTEITEIVERQ